MKRKMLDVSSNFGSDCRCCVMMKAMELTALHSLPGIKGMIRRFHWTPITKLL